MVVEHRELIDVDAVGLEVHAAGDIRVVHAGRIDLHRAICHDQRAGRMRIVRRAAHVEVRFECSGDTADCGREPLDETEAERAAVDGHVDAIRRGNRLAVSRRALRRTRAERGRRHVAFRRDPLRLVLLQPRIDRQAGPFVARGPAERLIVELAEAAVGHLKIRGHARGLGRPADDCLCVQAAGELRRTKQQRIDARKIH
jgi:hypothetical protein